jgi:hypothetical protein
MCSGLNKAKTGKARFLTIKPGMLSADDDKFLFLDY